MQNITLPVELVQRIAAYLESKPFREVAGLLSAIEQVAQQQAQKAEPQAPKPSS